MDTVDLALSEADRLRKILKKKKTARVLASEERSLAKATALTWFNAHRGQLASVGNTTALQGTDTLYKQILQASDRATRRASYDRALKSVRELLIALRADGLSRPAAFSTTSDQPPDFAPLIGEPLMQTILAGRWQECLKCLSAEAPLAATVMMGGLLEALLLGRINREANKAPIFQAKNAPLDKKGQPKPLTDWTLKNYIDVAHERRWISVSAKDVGEVLRDYRNYTHPFKQLSHNIQLTPEDATLFWEVSKVITRQVIKSVTT